jgi:hypothetical protein
MSSDDSDFQGFDVESDSEEYESEASKHKEENSNKDDMFEVQTPPPQLVVCICRPLCCKLQLWQKMI